jgi:hypothetical protein
MRRWGRDRRVRRVLRPFASKNSTLCRTPPNPRARAKHCRLVSGVPVVNVSQGDRALPYSSAPVPPYVPQVLPSVQTGDGGQARTRAGCELVPPAPAASIQGDNIHHGPLRILASEHAFPASFSNDTDAGPRCLEATTAVTSGVLVRVISHMDHFEHPYASEPGTPATKGLI